MNSKLVIELEEALTGKLGSIVMNDSPRYTKVVDHIVPDEFNYVLTSFIGMALANLEKLSVIANMS